MGKFTDNGYQGIPECPSEPSGLLFCKVMKNGSRICATRNLSSQLKIQVAWNDDGKLVTEEFTVNG